MTCVYIKDVQVFSYIQFDGNFENLSKLPTLMLHLVFVITVKKRASLQDHVVKLMVVVANPRACLVTVF